MNEEIQLIVDLDEETGLYYFVVKEEHKILHFRPGFRSREDAEHIGDLWIRDHLGGTPVS